MKSWDKQHPPHTSRCRRARIGKRWLYLANALTNQQIGLEETDDGLWAIYFHTSLLATFEEPDCIIQR